MKFKRSFGHVFQGNATPVELLLVFLTIALPVIIAVIVHSITHGIGR